MAIQQTEEVEAAEGVVGRIRDEEVRKEPSLSDVRGIGPQRLAVLRRAGITTVAELIATEPAYLGRILGMPEDGASAIIEGAKAL